MNSVTRLLIKSMNSLVLQSGGAARLHKSSLHVQTVAWPSSMHFSAPCIQQARNKTTEKPAWLICKLRVMAAIICHTREGISHSNIWPTTNLNLAAFQLGKKRASYWKLFVKTKKAGGGISRSPHGHWFHAKAQRLRAALYPKHVSNDSRWKPIYCTLFENYQIKVSKNQCQNLLALPTCTRFYLFFFHFKKSLKRHSVKTWYELSGGMKVSRAIFSRQS